MTDEILQLLVEHQAQQPDEHPYVFVPPKCYGCIQQVRGQGNWDDCKGLKTSDARNRTGDLRAINPLTKSCKGVDYQSLIDNECQDVATSVAKLLNECPELFEVIQAWPQLDEKLRKVVLVMVREVEVE